jgi:hypothetical protein
MKKIIMILLIFAFNKVYSQEIPLELFKGAEKCYVKTHRIIPAYDLKRTYMTTKNFYEFDKEGRIKEINQFGGNDSYKGYYTYSYSDTLDVRTFYSTHNVITERFTTEYLNEYGDTEETLYSWGGKLLRRTISNTDPEQHKTKFEYYNDAGYPLYSDVKVKFPDGRIELIITNDYDGYPVYYDYFVYDDNKRLDSQRKIDYLDSLITVVEYDYDDNSNLIKKATIDFETNRSTIENFVYDIMERITLETVYEKSQYFGGIEELVMKREIYYENFPDLEDGYHKGDEARANLESTLHKKAIEDDKKLTKLKAKEDKKKEKAEKKEQERLDKERLMVEERDVNKLEKAEAEKKQADSETENDTENEEADKQDGN